MPAIPALPSMPNAGPEMPAMLGNATAAGFTDALLAFLAPESAPTISDEDAQALGWSGILRLAAGAPGKGIDPDLPAAKPRADDKADESNPLLEMAALAALPVAAALIPPPQAATAPADSGNSRLQSAFDALTSAMSRALPGAEPAAARIEPKADREGWSFEMLEAHFAAAPTHANPVAHVNAAAQPAVDAPPGTPRFQEQTADTLRWMVQQGETRAEIALRPAELGPINVELKISGDQVQVTFVAAHPDTRDALQEQLPQLQELMAERGINLGQANVREESSPNNPFQQAENAANGDPKAENGAATPVSTARLPGGDHLVDTFA